MSLQEIFTWALWWSVSWWPASPQDGSSSLQWLCRSPNGEHSEPPDEWGKMKSWLPISRFIHTPPLPAPSSLIFSKSSSDFNSPSCFFCAKKNSSRFLCSSSTSEMTKSSMLGMMMAGGKGGPITSPGWSWRGPGWGGSQRSSGLLQISSFAMHSTIVILCEEWGIVAWLLNTQVSSALFSFHLFGRVRGRGGGFLDFLPLDMMIKPDLVQNFCCWVEEGKDSVNFEKAVFRLLQHKHHRCLKWLRCSWRDRLLKSITL